MTNLNKKVFPYGVNKKKTRFLFQRILQNYPQDKINSK